MVFFLQLLHLLLLELSQEQALAANHGVLAFAIHTQKREGGSHLDNDIVGNRVVVPSAPGTPDHLGFSPMGRMAPLEANSTLHGRSAEGPGLGSVDHTPKGDLSLQEVTGS